MKRNGIWRMMLAVAACAAAVMACGLPVGDAVPTATGLPTLAPLEPTATTEATIPAPEVSEVVIHMVALEDNGASGPAIGCGDSLIPVRREIAPTRQPLRAALDLLLGQKDQYYGESGLYNALYQSNLALERAEVNAYGTATVSLTGQVRLGGTCDTPRAIGQIEGTVLSIEGVKAASIFLNGEPIEDALSQR